MDVNSFYQAKCESCQGWHFALGLDDKGTINEIKCCKCRKISKYEPKLNLQLDLVQDVKE